jgi:hypothetical protein
MVFGLADDKGISEGNWLNNYYKKFLRYVIWLRGSCHFPFAALYKIVDARLTQAMIRVGQSQEIFWPGPPNSGEMR